MSLQEVNEALSLSRSSLFYSSNTLPPLDIKQAQSEDDVWIKELTKVLYFMNFKVGEM